jgi:large subunit ribosomal protein L18
VFRSTVHIYAQVIDDTVSRTMVAASTVEPDLRGTKGTKTAQAKAVGLAVAQRAKAAGITSVIFDRGGYLYHGRVKALADGAREGGLDF